jgi:hypothetical protein
LPRFVGKEGKKFKDATLLRDAPKSVAANLNAVFNVTSGPQTLAACGPEGLQIDGRGSVDLKPIPFLGQIATQSGKIGFRAA